MKETLNKKHKLIKETRLPLDGIKNIITPEHKANKVLNLIMLRYGLIMTCLSSLLQYLKKKLKIKYHKKI